MFLLSAVALLSLAFRPPRSPGTRVSIRRVGQKSKSTATMSMFVSTPRIGNIARGF
jgi:hypothetical protein